MDIHRLRSTLTTAGPHLGDVTFWALASARIDRSTLESVWASAGLDSALLPEPPTAEKALRTAAREAQIGQPDRLIRLGKSDENEIVFGVVREHRDAGGQLSYEQEASVALDRQTDMLSLTPSTHDLSLAIRDGYRVLRTTHTPDDVRRSIVKALDSFAAVTLRESGGVYWVPAPYSRKLRALQSAVEQIGSSRVHILPVHETPESKQALSEIAQGSLEQELAALTVEIASFLESPPERASTLLRRFGAYEALRSRATLYRDVLQVQVADLDERLDKLSAHVENLLAAKSDGGAPPVHIVEERRVAS